MGLLTIDCEFSGVSGDLLLSALTELIGKQKMEEALKKILHEIAPSVKHSVEFVKVKSQGISGYHLNYKSEQMNNIHNKEPVSSLNKHDSNDILEEKKHNHNHPDHQHQREHHEHSNDHEHHFLTHTEKIEEKQVHTHHMHYSVSQMRIDLNKALTYLKADSSTVEVANYAFDLIINAESKVHNIPIADVHLHEIGSLDTILDLVGTCYGFQELGVLEKKNSIIITPISVGNGTIITAHGQITVPAPATLEILKETGLIFKKGPIETELATPTGVAIIGSLKKLGFANQEEIKDSIKIFKSGVGIGSKIFPNRGNLLRINEIEIISSPSTYKQEKIAVLNTNVDDVRGELLGYLIQKIMNAGALDISITSTLTKKNRPGYLITVIALENQVSSLTNILMSETGTLGVRISYQHRFSLEREIITKQISLEGRTFEIHIKIAKNPTGDIIQSKIEFEDLRKIANVLGISIHDIENKILLNNLFD